MEVEIDVGALLPRLKTLASQRGEAQGKVMAAEAIHALVIFLVGTSATRLRAGAAGVGGAEGVGGGVDKRELLAGLVVCLFVGFGGSMDSNGAHPPTRHHLAPHPKSTQMRWRRRRSSTARCTRRSSSWARTCTPSRGSSSSCSSVS